MRYWQNDPVDKETGIDAPYPTDRSNRRM